MKKIKLLLKAVAILVIAIVFMAPKSITITNGMQSALIIQKYNDCENYKEISLDWPMHEGWPYELGGGQYIQSVAEDLDNDSTAEIIVLEKNILTVLTPNASLHSGAWPKTLPNTYWLAIGNLDLDSDLEIIVAGSGSSGGGTHIFNINGSYVAGWPRYDLNGGITLSDLDDDGVDEIIFAIFGEVSVLNADGTNYDSGWPIQFSYSTGLLAVGDIDNDGYEEIVIEVGMISSNDNYVYAYNHDGTLVDGEWPFNLSDDFVVSDGPVLGDLDLDGLLEISFATYENKVYVLNKNGEIFNNNWPITLPPAAYWSIALGNLNNKPGPEILVSGKTPDIYALDNNGSVLPGWPAVVDKPSSHPYNPFQNRLQAIGDVDDDGIAEILVGTLVGPYIFNNDGSTVVGADPMTIDNDYTVNSYHWGAISLADINSDDSVDVLISIWGKVYAYDFSGYIRDIEWLRYLSDLGLTGVYNLHLSADAGGPYEAEGGEEIQFTGNATGGVPDYSFHWDFGNGDTSDEQNPTYAYDEAGVYTVNLTVTDSERAVTYDETTATITEPLAELEITEIAGGMGVSATIENTGDSEVNNINWNISLDGGLILLGREAVGTLSSISVGEAEIITDKPVFGLGKIQITVTAEAPNATPATKTVDGFIFLFFVFI